jgi:hypothetical protein
MSGNAEATVEDHLFKNHTMGDNLRRSGQLL